MTQKLRDFSEHTGPAHTSIAEESFVLRNPHGSLALLMEVSCNYAGNLPALAQPCLVADEKARLCKTKKTRRHRFSIDTWRLTMYLHPAPAILGTFETTFHVRAPGPVRQRSNKEDTNTTLVVGSHTNNRCAERFHSHTRVAAITPPPGSVTWHVSSRLSSLSTFRHLCAGACKCIVYANSATTRSNKEGKPSRVAIFLYFGRATIPYYP